jgi:Dolichyl-phosphate-mannose-protein mannosyltransferase
MTFGWRTEPGALARNRERLALAAVLLLAAGLRLRHIDFGLPSLNDPDEPVFIMTALDMLREGRLNPGWFGHPATLLFYLLALVIAGVAAAGLTLGQWTGTDGFVAAVFADPARIVLPMRLLMAAFGVASVWMTWRLGRRVGGAAVGIAAALFLAVNALHVELSQVIRTDMLATLLMGWAMLRALVIAETGRARDHVVAGIAAGLACATKWPAMLVLVAPVVAGISQALADRRAWRLVPVAPLIAVATLLAVSPYILLDWPTVVRDLGGEARPIHPGATGFGLAGNLLWYVRQPIAGTFGIAGIVLLGIGTVATTHRRNAALVLLPTLTLVWVALSAQSLVWARWIVPLLPIAAVLIAIGLINLLRFASARTRPVALPAITALLATSMAHTTIDRQKARADDPRQRASAWIQQHVPKAQTILVEHAAFDLLAEQRRLLFPLGTAGCVDVGRFLAGGPSHRKVNSLRSGRAVVDLAHVEPRLLATCRADVLMLSNYRRYLHERVRFPAEVANYRRLLVGYRPVKTIAGMRPDLERLEVDIYRRLPPQEALSKARQAPWKSGSP